jgi:hypothetical protein
MISPKSKHQEGFALVLVLALVLLLVTVTLAFLSDSIFQRQISGSSANQSKVDLFAQGALDTTVGDLRQEIVTGSTKLPVSAGTASSTVYWPSTPASMVPQRMPAISGVLANLVKESITGQPLYSGASYTATGPSRAANSPTDSSSSMRPISAARWNAPLLLPKSTPGQNSNLTPNPAFATPDWIYVDRNGNNPTVVSANMVGRYAYCIYDEGGLLDLNVAGYPNEMDFGHAAYKLGSSLADLTQVGLTPSQIDTLLGWRNYASAQPAGEFPSYQFNNVSASNYFNSILSNPWGFMEVTSGGAANSPATLYNGRSDQKFASRQELINFLVQTLGANSDALQYMGTFSRSLDQPSYRPDPNRPTILSNTGTYSGAGSFGANVAGGNDAFGLDNQVNPFFLAVPVLTSFQRNDGTTAIVGEPLVKKRFGLNRLCWITYKGPIASLASSDAIVTGYLAQGISQQLIAQGTAANIQKYFGLTWNSTYWTYAHGIAGNNIGKFSDVQALSGAQAREPDFFELLKAALTVGSLGKTGAASHGTTAPNICDSDDYLLDTTTANQVLQIGANMIDQFDADSYPTHIQYVTSARTLDVYGSENLPYLYRARGIGVNLNLANSQGAMLILPEVWNPYDPASPAGNPVPEQFRLFAAGSGSQVYGETRIYYMSGSTPNVSSQSIDPNVADRGAAVAMDPMPAVTTGSSSFAPTGATELDFTVPSGSTVDHQPIFVGGMKKQGALEASLSTTVGGSNMVKKLSLPSGPLSDATIDGNGYITEDASSGTNTIYSYCGVLVGTFKTAWQVQMSPGPPAVFLNYPFSQTTPPPSPYQNDWGSDNPSSADECAPVSNAATDYILQYYQVSTGSWVTYQDNHAALPFFGQTGTVKASGSVVPASGIPVPRYLDLTQSAETGAWGTWTDPRTSRFGWAESIYVRNGGTTSPGTTTVDSPATTSYVSGGLGVADRPGLTFGSGFPYSAPGSGLIGSTYNSTTGASAIGWYPGVWAGLPPAGSTELFVPGYCEDNLSLTRAPSYGGGGGGANYFADPDGVVRRAMGGYAPASTTGLPEATPATLNSAPSRPYILNRPFRSVAELGYVFSGTPWRNLDFFTPESGSAALLDVFCLNETSDPNALVAGKINLNTRQIPVLEALLSGSGNGGAGSAYKDETSPGSTGATTELSSAEITQVATALVNRTTSTAAGQGPLENVADLVGRWNAAATANGSVAPYDVDGSQSYSGFSGDLTSIFSGTDPSLETAHIQRFRESAMRALSAGGQTRVWNLMIDLVAQTGKYPLGATSLETFLVDGERRYWLHVAIDRFTGKVIDENLEQVIE